MWQLDARNVGDADRPRNEVALWPELFGDQRYRWYAPSGKSYAVTHGAGGTATSMAVGSNDGLALANNLIEHLVGDDRRRIVLVPPLERCVRDRNR